MAASLLLFSSAMKQNCLGVLKGLEMICSSFLYLMKCVEVRPSWVTTLTFRVVDPDPDTDPDSDPIRIQGFDDQKLNKKNAAEIFYIFFWSKIAIYFSGPP